MTTVLHAIQTAGYPRLYNRSFGSLLIRVDRTSASYTHGTNRQIVFTMRLDTWSGLFVWFMIFEIQTVLATWSKYCTPFTKSLGPHPRGICGNQINEMLSLLCYMGYNRRKRDVGQDNNIIKGNDIFIRREEANSYLVKRSAYYDQGIVCECCYHRCNLRELLSYCRNDAAARFGLFKRSVENSLSNSRRHKQIDTDQSSND